MYRRPIVAVTIAFLLGIIIQYSFRLPLLVLLICTTVIAIPFAIFLYFKKRGILIILSLLIIIFGALHLEYNLNNESSSKSFVNKKVEIVGDCIQKDMTDKSVYILNINYIKYKGNNYALNDKTLLKVFDYEGKGLNDKKVLVKGILKIPDKARNPKMFDYNLFLRTQGINTILNVNEFNVKILESAEQPLLIKLRHKIKSFIYNETLNILPSVEGEMVLSIAFGDKKIIDKNLYNTFKTSGTAHVLAVSGLHFGILFVFIDSVLRKLKIKDVFKTIILLSLIWFFAIVVGFSPSVIRASSMITLFCISNLLNRKYDLFTSLALICLINVMINPLMIFNISFQLSFFAVTSIGLFYNPIYKKIEFLPDFFRKILATTLSAQLGTSPIIAYHFNIFSPISLLLNIPVVLLIGYILPVILILFIALPISTNISQFISIIAKILIDLLIKINSISSYLPYSEFNVESPKLVFLIVFYLGLISIFYKHKISIINKFKRRNILLIFLTFMFAVNSFKLIYPGKLKLTFVDVGQGDCILIETPKGKRVLIDGGNKQEDFLTKFLLKNHISYIDLVCISHIHNDHIGGITDVIENIKIGSIIVGTKKYSSEEWIELEKKCSIKNVSITEFTKGKSIVIEDELVLTAIHPSKELISNSNEDINNNSLVFILEYKDLEFLFTGDIEREAEVKVINSVVKRDIDIIKIGHHGSNTSSSPDFIDFFNPEIAVIQVGRNVFGHPHKDTLEKLSEREIKMYRNDKNGAVIIEIDGENIEVKTMINPDNS